jgi:hypothetical protein
MNIKRTPIALAISALLAAPLAMAQELTESYSVTVNNSGSIAIDSTSTSETVQQTRAIVDLNLTSKSQAVVDDKQLNANNAVSNSAHDNGAGISGTVGNGATGNIGVNTAAGDNNMQDNAAAIAAADAYFVFGAAESRAMTTQLSKGNISNSVGSNNGALVTGGFASAGGNIGINVAAGNSNMQKNNLAISSAPSRVSVASVQNVQRNSGNLSANTGTIVENGNGSTVATISLDLNGGTGTFDGTHEGSSYIPPDLPPEDHPFSTYVGTETGTVALAGTVSGTVTIPVALNAVNSQNNAGLSGDALAGATGNIGVNIAAGNNNQQNNSLSMAVSHAPTALPEGGLPPTIR